MKKFHEKHKDLLTAEGFVMISQSENNTNYKRDDDMFINITKKNDDYVIVKSILPNDDVEYTTTISIDDPTNIFERLIRRFHNPDVYQTK